MKWKLFFSFVFSLIVIFLLVFYLFFPLGSFEFKVMKGNSNFSVGNIGGDMQFYPNMRYANSRISYKIEDCGLQKKGDMQGAFDILENKTILEFYSVPFNEEILVTCDSKAKFEGGMFIAGEGGPVNITQTDNFNVILNGKVLLIRESQCQRPNIATHELLHALGFAHSANSENIMYNFTKCSQTLGDDIPELINNLYSFPSYSDLSFKDASALMHGRYLDINISIRNNGLKKSEDTKIKVYAGDKMVHEVELSPIDIGYGKKLKMRVI